MKTSVKRQAITLASQCHLALMSTQSQKMPGFPFGSVACYTLDVQCNPIFLLSDLAEHSQNLRVNNKLSLLVLEQAKADHPRDFGRLTLLGLGEVVHDEELESVRQIYLTQFPKDEPLTQFSDFHFWRLKVEKARYIGGFAKANWLEWTA